MWWKLPSMSCNRNENMPNICGYSACSFWNHVRAYLNDWRYLMWIALWAIAGYGFRLTHPVVGVDDVVIDLYFVRGLGAKVGRWPFYLLHRLLPVGYYTPFLLDFVGVLLLILSAILWCSLFQWISGRKFSRLSSVAFGAVMLNYSLNAEVFIYYLHNGVGLGSCMIPVAVYLVLKNGTGVSLRSRANWTESVCTLTLLTLAFSFYESMAAVFLLGLCLSFLVGAVCGDCDGCAWWKRTLHITFYAMRMVMYAVVIRTVMTKIVCSFLNAPELETYQMRSGMSAIAWLFAPGWQGELGRIVKTIWDDFIILGIASYSGWLLIGALALLLGGSVWLSIRRKKPEIILLAVAAVISSFCIALVSEAGILFRRICQCFPLLIGFVVLWVLQWTHEKENIRQAGTLPGKNTVLLAVIALMLCGMTLELQNSFAANYNLRTSEQREVEQLAMDLRRHPAVSEKPVVFTGVLWGRAPADPRQYVTEDDWCYPIIQKLTEKTGWISKTEVVEMSLMNYASWGFQAYFGPNYVVGRLLEMQGCSITRGSAEQTEVGKALAETMPAYPRPGYIQETEDFIVVRLS